MVCSNCGKKVSDDRDDCPHCGCVIRRGITYEKEGISEEEKEKEKVNIIFAIISLIFPVVGLIIFSSTSKVKPKIAKVYGICALIGIVASFTVPIIIKEYTDQKLQEYNYLINYEHRVDDESSGVIAGVLSESEDNEDITIESSSVSEMVETVSSEVDSEIDETVKQVEETVGQKENESGEGVSTDWKSYNFSVKGALLSVPCNYSDLSGVLGFDIAKEYKESYIQNGYYTYSDLYSDGKSALFIKIANNTGSDALYIDCPITRISQTASQASATTEIIFPGGLVAGQSMTTKELEKIFGKPSNAYEYIEGDFESYTWSYSEDPDSIYSNCFEITIVNGIIDMLALNHGD